MTYKLLRNVLLVVIGLHLCCTKDKEQQVGATDRVVIKNLTPLSITDSSAILGGEITSTGGTRILERGFCWSTANTPTLQDSTIVVADTVGPFYHAARKFLPNTIYYFRAYAKNYSGTIYAPVTSFRTQIGLPRLTTAAATNITNISVQSGGVIVSDGGSNILDKGVCLSSVNALPTASDTVVSAGAGSANYNATFNNLLGGRRYFMRAYARNTQGLQYASNVVQVVTSAPLPPTMSGVTVSNITRTSAQFSGSVSSNQGALITEYGFCYGTSPNPTIFQSRIQYFGNVNTAFSGTPSGLLPNTTYYVRAYAFNAAGGPSYSTTSASFITLPIATPTVVTTGSSSVSFTSAVLSGSVTNDGGANVFERGFYYSTTGTPNQSSPFIVASGTGTGNYSATLTGLTPNTVHNFVAYAKNAAGTALSSTVLNFRTLTPNPPTITTVAASNITASSFQSGGSISADGGAPIIQRGICWNTTGNPTTANNLTIDGSGLGSFTSVAGSLTSNTTYYVRAYAINSGGISGYGNQIIVQTSLLPPSLVSPANNVTLPCCNQWFNWSAVPGATSYEFQLSKSSTFAFTVSTLALCGSGSMNSTTVNRALPTTNSFCVGMGSSSNIGNWYWRVRAVAGSNVSAWSEVRTFYYPF
jgi:hypothetical protein